MSNNGLRSRRGDCATIGESIPAFLRMLRPGPGQAHNFVKHGTLAAVAHLTTEANGGMSVGARRE